LRSVLLCAGLVAASTTAAAQSAAMQSIGPGTVEASGGTAVPGGQGLLFVDDGQPGQVTWMRFDAQRAPSLQVVSLGGHVIDPEGITNDGSWIYVVGSQSRGGSQGADLVRFKLDSAKGMVSDLESLSGLPQLLSGVVSAGDGGKGKKGKGSSLNIEGLAWDGSRRRLLLGLRSPLAGGDAMVVPLAIGEGPLSASTVKAEAPVRIALGGRGIRSIEQVPGGGFLVVAGGVEGATNFALLSWDGTGAPKSLASLPNELKPEGVARASTGDKAVTVVLGDSGRYTIVD
jgi:hypothetical protein